MSNPAFIVKDLHKSFLSGKQATPVLRGVSVHFEACSSYAIMGASGSGKSTLMHLLAGLDTPTSGTISFDGIDLMSMRQQERALFLQKSVGLVFQVPYLIKELSVLENVLVRATIAGMQQADALQQAYAVLEQVGLADKVTSKPAELSGGQQQRVALARAVMTRPAFLLADEPTGNLDEQTGASMVDLLLACQLEWGMGIIVSTHDAYVAHRMNTLYQLKEGTLVTLKDSSHE